VHRGACSTSKIDYWIKTAKNNDAGKYWESLEKHTIQNSVLKIYIINVGLPLPGYIYTIQPACVENS